MHYKVIAFDFDGTLADSMALFLDAMKTASARYGFAGVRTDELDTLRGMNTPQLMAHFGIPAWKVPAVATTMRRLMTHGAPQVKLFPGIPQMLAALKEAGLRIGIATSNSKKSVQTVLGPESLSYIDYMECGASLFGKQGKLSAMVRRAKVKPKEMLYVGDELRDADASAAAKVDFAGVAWGYARPDVLQPRTVVELFETPQQVVEFATRGRNLHRDSIV